MRITGLELRRCTLAATSAALIAAAPAMAADGKTNKSWGFKSTLGFQYDDNVNTQPTDSQSGKADRALLFDVGAQYMAVKHDNLALEISYDFSQSIYDDLTEFNFQSHGLSAFAETTLSGFDVNALYGYTRAFLGGQDFLGLHIFQPTVGHLVTPGWYVSGSYSYQNKDFIDADSRDANLHAGEISSFLFFNNNKTLLKMGYRLEHENASGAQFDYLGNYLKAGLKTPAPLPLVAKPATFKLDYQFYIKDYSKITSEIGDERLDKRHTVTAALEIPLLDRLRMDLKAEYIRAKSNLSSSDFAERIYTMAFRLEY